MASVWSLMATLETEDGHVGTSVWEIGDALAAFFRDLAAAVHGFDGERSYDSREGQLSIRCTHDGRGTVTCEVTLARRSPPTWVFTAHMDLGSGAHLERIASDIEGFVAASN
jgi:hypothetical protein